MDTHSNGMKLKFKVSRVAQWDYIAAAAAHCPMSFKITWTHELPLRTWRSIITQSKSCIFQRNDKES